MPAQGPRDWIHLPIEHHALPDEWFEVHWRYASHRILNLLQEGNRVAIHCWVGYGRTGTVAARILTELEASPSGAVEILEQVQTGQQTNVHRVAYLESLDQPTRCHDQESRVLGCLLGGAVGDALGYEQELDEWLEVQVETGHIHFEPRRVHVQDLHVSHATQMSLFTLEGLARADRYNAKDLMAQVRLAYLDWLQTQEREARAQRHGTLCLYKEMQKKRDPSTACLSSLATGGDGTLLNPLNQVPDCGTLVRAAPLGLVSEWDLSHVQEHATQIAAITHGHPEENWSAAAMAGLVHLACKGLSLHSAGLQIMDCLAGREGASGVVQKLRQAMALAQGCEAMPWTDPRLGAGTHAAETLATSMYAALIGSSFENALVIGANQDCNSHITAALTGQLYGATYGISELPHAWVRRLDIYSAANSVIFSFMAD